MLSSPSQTRAIQREEPDPLGHLLKMIQEQGDMVRYHSDYGPVHFFNHPDHVQAVLHGLNFERLPLISMVTGQGLLVSEGKHWQAQRRLLQPSFHEKCLHGFGAMVVQASMDMLRRWEKNAEAREVLDIGRETRRLTLEIILKVLFGDVTQDEVTRMTDAVYVLVQHLGDLSDVLFRVPLSVNAQREERFRAALASLNQQVQDLTDRYLALSSRPPGVVAALLEAREKGALTDRQVRDEIVTMMVAGHETSAIGLAWAIRLLSEHPEVKALLTSEVDTILDTRMPTIEDVPRLAYTRMVFDEALRLYPPVSVVVRRVVKEEVVASAKIPAGGVVVLSPYTTHRHPAFWVEPERFDPSRFHPDRARDRHRYAYFPFLGGRHQCLGQGFAAMEATLILAVVSRYVDVQMLPHGGQRPTPGIALRMEEGLPATVEFRTSLRPC